MPLPPSSPSGSSTPTTLTDSPPLSRPGPADRTRSTSSGSTRLSSASSSSIKGKDKDLEHGVVVIDEESEGKGGPAVVVISLDGQPLDLQHSYQADLRRPQPERSPSEPSLLSIPTYASPTFNSLASSQRPILSPNPSSDASGLTGLSSETPARRKRTGGGGTVERKRLAALGFEEELTRDFDFWASWGIGMCNIGFLHGTVLGLLTAMGSGGGSMYTFAWPLSGIFMCGIAAILGEMASTYPVAGAMFTWTFRICRSSRRLDSWARFASWIVGSFLLCSHVLIQIIITYQLAGMILGVVALHLTGFEPSFWKRIGICWAVLTFSGLVVSSPLSRSPWLWRGCGALLVLGWVTIISVLLSQTKEIKSPKVVFTSYNNDTGWSSKSYVYMIGWVLTCVASGLEACAHMAEDTKTPSRTVPMAMFWSTTASYLMGWVSICVLVTTTEPLGRDPRLQPAISLLSNTLSLRSTTLVVSIILFAMTSQNVAQLLATSRFVWALARESALPFSNLFKSLSPRLKQPLPAIWGVVLIAAPALLLIRISPHVIGTILLEGAGWSVMFAYLAPISLYLFCDKDALSGDGRAEWTLRSWSQPMAWGGCAFAVLFLIVLCFPVGYPVTSLSASYAAGIAMGLFLLSSLTWIFYGNARYAGPIKTTTRWTVGAEIELPTSSTFKSVTVASDTTSAAHGQRAQVYSTFPTLTSNAPPESTEWDSGSGREESRVSTASTIELEERERRRWVGTEEEGVRGRARSANGREEG